MSWRMFSIRKYFWNYWTYLYTRIPRYPFTGTNFMTWFWKWLNFRCILNLELWSKIHYITKGVIWKKKKKFESPSSIFFFFWNWLIFSEKLNNFSQIGWAFFFVKIDRLYKILLYFFKEVNNFSQINKILNKFWWPTIKIYFFQSKKFKIDHPFIAKL